MVPFEDANAEAYRFLLRIEVAVREILRIALRRAHGERWQRQLLLEMRQKISKAMTDEQVRRQFAFQRLGPLYYLTFGELIPLLQQKTAKQAVDRLGGTAFLSQLELISSPRNAVAHSRNVSDAGLATIRTVYQHLENSIGKESLTEILKDPDVGVDPMDAVPAIHDWLSNTSDIIRQLQQSCVICPMYKKAELQFWWGMTDVCDIDYKAVDEAAQGINGYNCLPIGIGSAIERQRYIDENSMTQLLARAAASLRKVAR